MLRDNVGVEKLIILNQVPIPVDIHVARATLSTGIVRGSYNGNLDNLFEWIRNAWFKSVVGCEVNNRPMIALEVDEPLWHLSKYGCTKRNKISGECPKIDNCEAKEFCILGSININTNNVELNT